MNEWAKERKMIYRADWPIQLHAGASCKGPNIEMDGTSREQSTEIGKDHDVRAISSIQTKKEV